MPGQFLCNRDVSSKHCCMPVPSHHRNGNSRMLHQLWDSSSVLMHDLTTHGVLTAVPDTVQTKPGLAIEV